MTGNTYKPEYEKIYKPLGNWKFQSLDEINIPIEDLEVMATFQANNIQIFKYVPLSCFKALEGKVYNDNGFNDNGYFVLDGDGILENCWLDYFLDMECTGSSSIRRYWDETYCKGFKALNKEKSWFVKLGESEDVPPVDYYMKIRRVKIKEVN